MQKSLPLLTAFVLLALAGRGNGQPRPADSSPLDFVPSPEQELLPRKVPAAAPAPIVVNSGIVPSIAEPWPEPGPQISPHVDKSRYVSYGGRLWYLQPTNRWSYWSEGRWVDYVPPMRGNTPPFVQPPPPVRRHWHVGAWTPYYRYPYAPGPAYPYGGAPYPMGGY
jgi:hypothetical protein